MKDAGTYQVVPVVKRTFARSAGKWNFAQNVKFPFACVVRNLASVRAVVKVFAKNAEMSFFVTSASILSAKNATNASFVSSAAIRFVIPAALRCVLHAGKISVETAGERSASLAKRFSAKNANSALGARPARKHSATVVSTCATTPRSQGRHELHNKHTSHQFGPRFSYYCGSELRLEQLTAESQHRCVSPLEPQLVFRCWPRGRASRRSLGRPCTHESWRSDPLPIF